MPRQICFLNLMIDMQIFRACFSFFFRVHIHFINFFLHSQYLLKYVFKIGEQDNYGTSLWWILGQPSSFFQTLSQAGGGRAN